MTDIYSFIKAEETSFQTDKIQIGDNWYWNFRDHVQLLFHLKNSVFYTGNNDWLRAFRNIMQPILNLAYWTEDIEVKDVVFYIEEKYGKVLSFLVKKYFDEVYVKTHNLDMLFDEITESDLDYGGVIVQKGVDMPEVLQLNSVAFCDQTDMLGGPIAFKYFFSPDKLREMGKVGWGSTKNGATTSLDELAILATTSKEAVGTTNKKPNRVPGKSVEIYIVRGNLPERYLEDNDNMDDYYNQVQVVAFYTDKDSKKQGVTLYRKKEENSNLKFFTSKKIYQRALGQGVGETLLHPQIWTNFLTIHKTDMLAAASKVPLYTDDSSYDTKNKIQDMENLEITKIEDGKRIYQVPTAAPANISLYSNEINSWFEYAQFSGAAYDPLLGKEASSGTTFRGQERSVAQGQGIHSRRRGQRAKFIEELLRTFVLPDIKSEILKGQTFMAELSNEELSWVVDQLALCEASKRVKEAFLNGQIASPEEIDLFVQKYKAEFLKKGNKHLLEILGTEFEDIEIKLGINIAGKQKDLATLSDKLLSIFQFIFANPAAFQTAMQIPALAKAFENLLEFGGMSIGDFSSLLKAPAQQLPQGQPQGQGQAQLSPIAPLPLAPSRF